MSAPSQTESVARLLSTLVAGRAAVLHLASVHLPFSRLAALHVALSDETEGMGQLSDMLERRLAVARPRSRPASRPEPTDDLATPTAAATENLRGSTSGPALPSRLQRAIGKAELLRPGASPPSRATGVERRAAAREVPALASPTLELPRVESPIGESQVEELELDAEAGLTGADVAAVAALAAVSVAVGVAPAPVEAAAAESAPVEVAPVEVAPVRVGAPEAPAAEVAHVAVEPAESAPVPAATVPVEPAEAPPAERAPTEVTPVDAAPAPVEAAEERAAQDPDTAPENAGIPAIAVDLRSASPEASGVSGEDIHDEPTPSEAAVVAPFEGLLVESVESPVVPAADGDVSDPPSLTRIPARGFRAAEPKQEPEIKVAPPAPPPVAAAVATPVIAPPPARVRPQVVVQAGPPQLPEDVLEPLDEPGGEGDQAAAAVSAVASAAVAVSPTARLAPRESGSPRVVAASVAGVRAAGPGLEDDAIGGDDEDEDMAGIGVSAPGGGIQLGGAAVKKRPLSEPSAAPRLTDEDESPQTDVPQSPSIRMAGDDGRIAQLLDEAISAAGRSDLAKAIQAYTDIVDLRHDRGDAYIGRGRAYLELGDYSSAMSDFQRAEDLQPDRPDSHVAMGDLYFARKEYRRAIEFYDQAVELDGSHAMARCRRGISHYYRKNYRQAFQDLQRAYSLDPEIPNIRKYVQMAVKKMERGD